ncbi:MAG: hypothetical protein ACREOO_25875 [bacterium]
MPAHKQQKERGHERAPQAARRKASLLLAASGAVLVVFAAVFMFGRGQRNDTITPAAGSGGRPAGGVAPAQPDFQKLKGQWQRPDGGYVIDIMNIEANGKMQAGYYNPRPIHVARAEAADEGATLAVFIELNDVNYPGSTYTLRYDPANDQLHGVYYQAALQQNFEVAFVRMK